jgi:Superinfection immunity protein
VRVDALANSYVFWIVLILLLAAIYLLPTLIGVLRGVENFALLFALNCLGGLTCIGWPAALIAAFMLPRRPDRR